MGLRAARQSRRRSRPRRYLVVPCLKRLQGVARSSCGPAELPVTFSSSVSLDAVRP